MEQDTQLLLRHRRSSSSVGISRAHGQRSPERSILEFCGIGPIRASLIGIVGAGGGARGAKWLRRLNALGRRGR